MWVESEMVLHVYQIQDSFEFTHLGLVDLFVRFFSRFLFLLLTCIY